MSVTPHEAVHIIRGIAQHCRVEASSHTETAQAAWASGGDILAHAKHSAAALALESVGDIMDAAAASIVPE